MSHHLHCHCPDSGHHQLSFRPFNHLLTSLPTSTLTAWSPTLTAWSPSATQQPRVLWKRGHEWNQAWLCSASRGSRTSQSRSQALQSHRPSPHLSLSSPHPLLWKKHDYSLCICSQESKGWFHLPSGLLSSVTFSEGFSLTTFLYNSSPKAKVPLILPGLILPHSTLLCYVFTCVAIALGCLLTGTVSSKRTGTWSAPFTQILSGQGCD